MTHAELVALAVAWLRRGVSIETPTGNTWPTKHVPAFAEFVTYSPEKPDAIGWHDGVSMVVECKVSRADFFADRTKPHMGSATSGMGRRRYYLVPDGLVVASEVPDWCGLAYARGRSVDIVRPAPMREIDQASAVHECLVLASAIRRHVLSVPFDEKRGRFETLAERDSRRDSGRKDAGNDVKSSGVDGT